MAEMRSSRGTTDGAAGISGGNLHSSDHARVNALGRTVVYAKGNSQIDAYESSTIYAGGDCRVKVVSWGAVTVHLSDNAVIDDLVGDAKILTANLEGN